MLDALANTAQKRDAEGHAQVIPLQGSACPPKQDAVHLDSEHHLIRSEDQGQAIAPTELVSAVSCSAARSHQMEQPQVLDLFPCGHSLQQFEQMP